MFGLSFGEILIILVVALLVLGPSGMPKLARTLGKGLRDFRRATGDIRGSFEQEFYKLDEEVKSATKIDAPATPPTAGIEPGSLDEANAPPAPANTVLAPEGTAPRTAAPPEGTAPRAAAALAPPEGTAPRQNVAVAAAPADAPPTPAPKAPEETR